MIIYCCNLASIIWECILPSGRNFFYCLLLSAFLAKSRSNISSNILEGGGYLLIAFLPLCQKRICSRFQRLLQIVLNEVVLIIMTTYDLRPPCVSWWWRGLRRALRIPGPGRTGQWIPTSTHSDKQPGRHDASPNLPKETFRWYFWIHTFIKGLSDFKQKATQEN